MESLYPLTAFRFEVRLLRAPDIESGSQNVGGSAPSSAKALKGVGGFQECAGLEIEMDIQDYQEGGRNNGVIRRVGRAKFPPIVLKRGMFHARDGEADAELWRWMQRIINGERPVERYDGLIHVMSADGELRASWMFDRGLPAKIRGPELNARTGEIAIEELSIAHEGLRLLAAEAA